MNLRGSSQVEQNSMNVVSLFGNLDQDILEIDPMAELMEEAMTLDSEDEVEDMELAPRKVVNVLDEQLSKLRSSLNRIRFYLGDLEDMIPR
jgi:hypothetical protein